jgi:excisionase family DNA binding protein
MTEHSSGTNGTVTDTGEAVYTPAEVARMFRVDPKTVTRWAKAGKLTSVRTPDGHLRFRAAEVQAFLAGRPARNPDALDDGEMLTCAEVAGLAGVDTMTVARWAKRGELAGSRAAGGAWEFTAGTVRAFLTARRANRCPR